MPPHADRRRLKRTSRSHDHGSVAIGGSDAGISAALRARELDPGVEFTVVVADAYPNFSICGIPYYVSGEVTHWRNLAHRTAADLEATGMRLRLDTLATRHRPRANTAVAGSADGAEEMLAYDELDRRHRRRAGPAPDRRPRPSSAPTTACTSCTRWATRSRSCTPSNAPASSAR